VSDRVDDGGAQLPSSANEPHEDVDASSPPHHDSRPVRLLDAIARHRAFAGAGILVVIAAVAILLLRSGSDSEQTTSTSSGGTAVIDNFGRPDSDAVLGTADSAAKWKAQSGVWGIKGHAARLVRADGKKPGVATVDLGASDGLVRVTESVVENGAGLAFRYRDLKNYWSVQAAPSFATWVVVKVVDGKRTQVTNLGFSATRNAPSVGVQLDGARIQVFVNGVLLRTLQDSALKYATKMGLFASGPGGPSARFTAFVAAPAGAPVPTSTPAVPAPSTAATTALNSTTTAPGPGTTRRSAPTTTAHR